MNTKQKRKPHLRSGYQVDAILYEWFQIHFTKSFENAYVKEVNAECDDFPCFEINTKFVEHLLFDLVEKYENEGSKNEETNNNSVEEVEEDTAIT